MMFMLTARLLATLSAMLALSPSGVAQAITPTQPPAAEQAIEPAMRAAALGQPGVDDQDRRALNLDDPGQRGWTKRMVRPCVRTGNRMIC